MDGRGTELPRRATMAHGLIGAAAVLTLPCLAAARSAARTSGATAAGSWAMTVAILLLLVVAPLLLACGILGRRTWVSPTSVTVERGGRVHQQLDLADLTEVRVRVSGNGGDTLRNERVLLLGTPRTGPGRGLVVSRFQVQTLRPLLARLAAEVEARPELLASALERDYFARALETAP